MARLRRSPEAEAVTGQLADERRDQAAATRHRSGTFPAAPPTQTGFRQRRRCPGNRYDTVDQPFSAIVVV
jgi:hypothetical protein